MNIQYCKVKYSSSKSYECKILYQNSVAPMLSFPLSKLSLLLFASYALFLILLIIYDLSYFYLSVPNSLAIRLNIGILHSFIYIKELPDFTPYIPSIFQLSLILSSAFLQFIIIRLLSNSLPQGGFRTFAISTVYYSFTFCYIYLIWSYIRMHYSTDMLLYGNGVPSNFSHGVLSNTPSSWLFSWLPAPSIQSSNANRIVSSSVPILKYLHNNNMDPGPYSSLFNHFKFNINNAYVFKSNAFGYAMIAKYPSHSNLFICDNLLRGSYFNIFRAVFYHEMGHYTLGHGSSIIMAKSAFLLSTVLFLLYTVFIKYRISIRRIVNMSCIILVAALIFRMLCNVHTQSLEYEADRFACKEGPEVMGSLAFTLLQDLKMGTKETEHKISTGMFMYPDKHPLYTHPSKMNRIAELKECIRN